MGASISDFAWSEISRYLDNALELEPGERSLWLDDLTTANPRIADTLRQFIAEYEHLDADGFVNGLCIPAAGLRKNCSLSGHQVGAYKIDKLLGRGGMGEVWRASRTDGRFEGYVAIKILDRSIGHVSVIDRFRREGRLLARLAHPHIARLLDAGSMEDNHPYLVLEYVEGESIDKYCEAHSLNIGERVRLFLDVISAVAHAHTNLIIHRDLKPSNVLVTRDGKVKLLDFGIAKIVNPDGTDDASTRIEDVALTPEYAAPEQLLGEMPSTTTDVYQLGMLLYVLLTGKHPLQLTGTRGERVKAALNGTLPRASEFVGKPLRGQLSGDLDAILSTALDRDRKERYQTAIAFRDDLERYLTQQPVSARHGGMYRLRRFAARHKFQVAAVLIVVLAVAASAAVSFRQARTASRERDRAFALASRNAAISEFTERLLVEAAASKAPITVRDILAKSEVMLLADEADSVENRAAVLNLIAGRYYEVGDIRKALELREHALSLIEGSKDTELRSYLICAHAYSLHRLGQTEEAARRIERELDHLDSASSTSAGCHYYLSAVRETLGDGEGALRSALRALREYQAAPDKTAGEEISILGAVAMAYNSMGNVEQASQYFGFGLDKLKTLGRERSTEAMTMRNNLAVLSISAGVPKRALAMFDELLDDAAESKLSTQANAAHVINRARALDLIGRFSEAKETYQHCLNLAEQQQDITAQTTCLVGLASVAQRSGDRAAAELFLAKADQAGGATMRDSAPMKTRALIQGRLDLADGNLESARENFELSRSGNKKPSGRIDTTLAMAELELSSGNIAAAISNAQAALAISKSQQGDEKFSNRTGLSSLMLGRALQKQGNMVEARDAFETAVAHLSNTVDEQHPALVQARQLLSSST